MMPSPAAPTRVVTTPRRCGCRRIGVADSWIGCLGDRSPSVQFWARWILAASCGPLVESEASVAEPGPLAHCASGKVVASSSATGQAVSLRRRVPCLACGGSCPRSGHSEVRRLKRDGHDRSQRGPGPRGVRTFGRGDVARMLEFVDPELEWTYLNPAFENPEPRDVPRPGPAAIGTGAPGRAGPGVTDRGDRGQRRQGDGGHPHAWHRRCARVRQAKDRNYLVLTLDQQRIIRMRACRDQDEARSFAGIT